MYGYPTPHYALLCFGLFIGITSGLAFQETLKQKVREWYKIRKLNADDETAVQDGLVSILQSSAMRLPYFGIMIGVCIFLASGVEIFGFGTFGAYGFSAAMTLLTSMLIWYQLTKILTLLQDGGSEALDLESVF